MKLTVKERVILLSVLPGEGDFLSLKLVRKLREDLSFSEEETKMFEMKHDKAKGQISWDPNCTGVEKEVEIGLKTYEIIKEALEALNRQKKLQDGMIELYEKFVEQQIKL